MAQAFNGETVKKQLTSREERYFAMKKQLLQEDKSGRGSAVG